MVACRLRLVCAVFAILGILVGQTGTAAAAATAPVTRNGELVADGAWCWFQDPRAIHYVGAHDRTYVGYVTSTGDIDVVSLDTGTAALTHTTLHPKFQADDHAAPGLEVLGDGRIAVFYSKHGGARMYYRVSVHPEDISVFGREQTVGGRNTPGGKGYTYANPIYLPAEHRTYLFFRSGDNRPAVTWSSDLRHWSDAQDVVVPDGAGTLARPYVKYATNGTDSILIAFTDGHPRDVPTNSIYAIVYSHGVLHAVDGTPLATLGPATSGALPPAPVHTRNLTPAYDGSGPEGKAWVHSAAFDQDGHPVIAFASFPRQEHRRTRTTAITTRAGPVRRGPTTSSPKPAARSCRPGVSRTTPAV